jgi:hypothetical protein
MAGEMVVLMDKHVLFKLSFSSTASLQAAEHSPAQRSTAAHLAQILQCFDLAGRSTLHVQHSLSGHMALSLGYSTLWTAAFSAVTVPGSDKPAAAKNVSDTHTRPVAMNLQQGAKCMSAPDGTSQSSARVQNVDDEFSDTGHDDCVYIAYALYCVVA